MENADRELILKVMHNNAQLKRLYEEHLQFEKKLDAFGRKKFLTSEEQVEEKKLKKLKLLGVDNMMSIVNLKLNRKRPGMVNAATASSKTRTSAAVVHSEATF